MNAWQPLDGPVVYLGIWSKLVIEFKYLLQRLAHWLGDSFYPVVVPFLAYRLLEFACFVVCLVLLRLFCPTYIEPLLKTNRQWLLSLGVGFFLLWKSLHLSLGKLISWGVFWLRWAILRWQNARQVYEYSSLPEQLSIEAARLAAHWQQYVKKYRANKQAQQQWWQVYRGYAVRLGALAKTDREALQAFIQEFKQDLGSWSLTSQVLMQKLDRLLVTSCQETAPAASCYRQLKRIFYQIGELQLKYPYPPADLSQYGRELTELVPSPLSHQFSKLYIKALEEALAIVARWFQGWNFIICAPIPAKPSHFFSLLQRNNRLCLRKWGRDGTVVREFIRDEHQTDWQFCCRILEQEFSSKLVSSLKERLQTRLPSGVEEEPAVLAQPYYASHSARVALYWNGRANYVYECYTPLKDHDQGKITRYLGMQGHHQRGTQADTEVRFLGLQAISRCWQLMARYRSASPLSVKEGSALATEFIQLASRHRPFYVHYAYGQLRRESKQYTAYSLAQFMDGLKCSKIIARLLHEMITMFHHRLLRWEYYDGSCLCTDDLICDLVKLSVEDLLATILHFQGMVQPHRKDVV